MVLNWAYRLRATNAKVEGPRQPWRGFVVLADYRRSSSDSLKSWCIQLGCFDGGRR